MKKLILTLTLTLASICILPATTYITSGEGQGVWADPASWRIAGHTGIPTEAPTAEDDVIIEHYLSHRIEADYTHLGKLSIARGGTYEVSLANDLVNGFHYQGPRMEVQGTLMVGGDLVHQGVGELAFLPQAWVMIGGNLELTSAGGLLNLSRACGGVEVSRDLLADVENTFVAGNGSMMIYGQLRPYRASGAGDRSSAPGEMAQIMEKASAVYNSPEACQAQTPLVAGQAQAQDAITWGSFETRVAENEVRLSWRTLSERFGTAFTVERSADGTAFEKIASLPTQSEDGYAFEDATINSAQVHYRIRFTDLRGQEAFSPVSQVTLAHSAHELELYPNPYRGGLLTLKQPELKAETPVVVTVHSLSGLMVNRFATYANQREGLQIENLGDLPQGIYVVTLEQGDFRSSQQLMIR